MSLFRTEYNIQSTLTIFIQLYIYTVYIHITQFIVSLSLLAVYSHVIVKLKHIGVHHN